MPISDYGFMFAIKAELGFHVFRPFKWNASNERGAPYPLPPVAPRSPRGVAREAIEAELARISANSARGLDKGRGGPYLYPRRRKIAA